MNVLVTGACGQLGHDVCCRLAQLGVSHKGIDQADCDLTDATRAREVILAAAPDAVVHCAAYTAVDKAESDGERCRSVNVGATENVARACAECGAKMMYISTDYVFSGEGDEPFEVDDPKQPQNVYGSTKYDGELAVQELCPEHFILRISWAFGVGGGNFVKTMIRLGAEQQEVRVVCDQVGSPTYTVDLARLICQMIRTQRYGVYHATNEGFCSWYEFAQAIMAQCGLDCQVIPVLSQDYPSAAKRPHNSRLSKASLDDAGFARLPPWQDALRRYLVQIRGAGG